VIAADVYGRAPFVGRGGWTWYTGAAAWTWRLGVEAILGLRREAGSLVVDPCIPATWDGFEAWIKQDDLTIHVVVDNASGRGRGVAEARLDGARLSEARVELRGSGQRRLEIVLGAPAHGFRQARASW
jgi:cyclic beta-1,2-glucan synthetase